MVTTPISYLMLSGLIDLHDFYWIVTITWDIDLDFSCSMSHGILGKPLCLSLISMVLVSIDMILQQSGA